MANVTEADGQRADVVLDVIRSRRVTRNFTDEPVSGSDLRKVLEAARWASSAGNRRITKFIAVSDPALIRLIKAISPGMLGQPTALIVICTDLDRVREEQMQVEKDSTTWIDVGTAAMNMMIAAHALNLGTCPTTSFSRSGIRVILDLPPTIIPEFILQLGHPAPQKRVMRPGASTRLDLKDIAYSERYGEPLPW